MDSVLSGFLANLGVMVGPVVTIVGLVELVKLFFKDKIAKLADNDKAVLDRVWIGVVAFLSVGASVLTTIAAGFSWAQLLLNVPAYLVGSVGTYVSARIVFPWIKKE